jgi:hypothetical protein
VIRARGQPYLRYRRVEIRKMCRGKVNSYRLP